MNSIPVAMMICTVVVAAVAIMMMAMMVTAGFGIIFQFPLGQRFCRFVCRPLNAGIELDPCI